MRFCYDTNASYYKDKTEKCKKKLGYFFHIDLPKGIEANCIIKSRIMLPSASFI